MKESPEEKEVLEILDMATPLSKRTNFIINQLGKMGSRISSIAPVVARRIKSGDQSLNQQYYTLLAEMGEGASGAVEILKNDLTDYDLFAFDNFGSAAKSALPELKKHLREQDQNCLLYTSPSPRDRG